MAFLNQIAGYVASFVYSLPPTDILAGIGIIVIVIVVALFYSRMQAERERYEFITIIAHKFRTPLTHIKWSTENLASNATDPYLKQDLNEILGSGERLIALTGTLVELTDNRQGSMAAYRFERINICDLMRQTAEDAKQTFAEKNLSITVACSESEIWVKADRTHLAFAFETILENACLYSESGHPIEVSVLTKWHTAEIYVTDHGIGIEPRELGHIFDKFHRSKDARTMNTEGLGVGLYLARSVIRRHKGRISLFSEGENLGTTARVILPRVK